MTELIKLKPRNPVFGQLLDDNKYKKQILFRHGHIAITNYKLKDNWDFEKMLSTWDAIRHRYDLKGGYYIPELKELRIPRGFSAGVLRRMFPKHIMKIDNKVYPYTTEDIELYTAPNKDLQTVILSHMLSKYPYQEMAKYTQQVITMDTGDGKTYCAIAATTFLKAISITFIPIAKLTKQWYDSFLKFTSLKEDQIKIIQGSEECEKLRRGEYKNRKAFIIIIDTFISYVNRYGNIKAMQMLYETNAYVKIIDEVHKELNAIMIIEALSNFKMNYYLTASFGRANIYENKLFKTLFNDVPKFGHDFKNDDEKHVNIIVKKYYFKPSQDDIMKMYRRKIGLNIKKYEEVLLTSGEEKFSKELRKMLKWSKDNIKPGNKLLILCSTLNGIDYVAKEAGKVFTNDTIGCYHSKLTENEKKASLDSRIIIGTDQGLGTGADIKGLQHTINIITYSNFIGAKQYSGRGRKIDDSTPIVYIEMVNFGYEKTIDQFNKRQSYLADKSPSGKIIYIE